MNYQQFLPYLPSILLVLLAGGFYLNPDLLQQLLAKFGIEKYNKELAVMCLIGAAAYTYYKFSDKNTTRRSSLPSYEESMSSN